MDLLWRLVYAKKLGVGEYVPDKKGICDVTKPAVPHVDRTLSHLTEN